MFCTNCGARIEGQARFCPNCGRPVAAPGAGPVGATPAPLGPEGTMVDADVTVLPTQQRNVPSNVGRWQGAATGGFAQPAIGTPPLTAQPADGMPALIPSVAESYSYGWRQLWRHFLPLFVVGLVAGGAGLVAWLALYLAGWLMDTLTESDAFFTGVASTAYNFLVAPPLYYGFLYASLRAVRDEAPQVGDAFAPFQRAYVASVVSSLVVSVLVVVGLLLLVVPGIVAGVRLAFVPLLVADEGLGPIEAIKQSWARTQGYGWTIFGLWVLAVAIVVAGLVLLIVGVVPAMMWVALAQASLFAAVTRRRQEPAWPQFAQYAAPLR